MKQITQPYASVKEIEENVTPKYYAKCISEGLYRNVISARNNGQTVETNTP